MTNKILLSIIFILLFLGKIFAQNPENPDFCFVSVTSDSTVLLSWKITDTSSIDGFIIKRKIIDGQGVVNGTFNNIEVIRNPSATRYIDTSTDYNTFTKPFLRSETYRIATYVTVNDSIYYGIASSDHKTIFLNANFDTCNKKILLHWTKYWGRQVKKYWILADTGNNFSKLAETADTSFSIPTKGNKTYLVKIAAILPRQNSCEPDTSFSNTAKIKSESPIAPDTLYIINTQFDSDSSVILNFLISKGKMIKDYVIYGENDSLVSIFPHTSKIEVPLKNYYQIKVKDICANIIKNSNIATPIQLIATQHDTEIKLVWNAYENFFNGIENYEIYMIAGEDTLLTEQTVEPQATVYIADILDEIGNLKQIKFYVVANENGYNIYNVKGKSISDTVLLTFMPVVKLPNALRPSGKAEQNRFFIPKIFFSEDFDVLIFDNKGIKVFESHNNEKYWDGTYNGKPLPAGIYLYIIKIKTYSGELREYKGKVTLIE